MQNKTPLHSALLEFKTARIVPFDVPGHKRGKGNRELTDFLGEKCLSVDVNSMKPLDNLCHPTGVISEAEKLAAEAFSADHAFFMVNGTTSSVQAMIMSICKDGDKIILPRNVHRSVINSLILCGAVPVYIEPKIDLRLGIPLGIKISDVIATINEHSDAKAVLINNPTYYGICSDVSAIIDIAHSKGMFVLADEAHGTHFYFGEGLPIAAMKAGADMAAVSMHKSGGSLTQSSILLCSKSINADYVRQIINLTQTTSASYLLMASLDISRKNLALKGKEIFSYVKELTEYARAEINEIGNYYAFSKELIDNESVYDFDTTKLSINTFQTGLAGIEVYDLLRDEYDIQIEFGDIGNILAYISVGDSEKNIERLISALSEIHRLYSKESAKPSILEYTNPKVVMTPRDAFYANKKSVLLSEGCGGISSEFVMCYPPGIPVLAPGEEITDNIIEYIKYAKEKGCLVTGTEDMSLEKINIIEE